MDCFFHHFPIIILRSLLVFLNHLLLEHSQALAFRSWLHPLPLQPESLLESHLWLKDSLDRETWRLTIEHVQIPEVDLRFKLAELLSQLTEQRCDWVFSFIEKVKRVKNLYLVLRKESSSFTERLVQGAQFAHVADCLRNLYWVGKSLDYHKFLQVVDLAIGSLQLLDETDWVNLT